MDRDTELYILIGRIAVGWAQIERRIDGGVWPLDLYEQLFPPPPNDKKPAGVASASRQFERVRKEWRDRFARIDLGSGLYACNTAKTAADLKRHRHLRDILVHGAPSIRPFMEGDLVGVTMDSGAKSAFFQASVQLKRKEMLRKGMSPRALRHGLREFMAQTGELLIPLADIRQSADHLRQLDSEISEAHMDLHRIVSAERSRLNL